MTALPVGHDLPLVSVIIPAYNAADSIERTLNSVLNQTYRHIEVLVIDDGSTDNTAAIVTSIAQHDSRLVLLHQRNSGVAAARNLGIQEAKGEFIAPIDADDLWYLNNLQRQVACFLSSSASLGVVYSWSVDMDATDRPTGNFHAATIEGDVYSTLICHNFLGNASCTMIRKSCFATVGGYNCEFRLQQAQGCEDWDLYLRLAACYEFRAAPEFLVGYRKTQHSMSRDYRAMARSQALMLRAAKQHSPAVPAFLHRLSRSSFCLYLAHQCSLNGDDSGRLFWLGETLRAEPITPLLRPSFYRMAAKNWWPRSRTAPSTLSISDAQVQSSMPSPFSLFLKLQIGRGLHQVLRWVTPSLLPEPGISVNSIETDSRGSDRFADQR